MSFQSSVPPLESFAEKFAHRLRNCLYGKIQVDENYLDNSQGFSVNRTIEEFTDLITYTADDYYAGNPNYDPSKPTVWPPPLKVDVRNKLEGEGYTINSIHNAQVPYKWTTLAGVGILPISEPIEITEELNGLIAASERIASEIYWNLYGFNGRATFEEFDFIGDIVVEATRIVNGFPVFQSFQFRRDDYYADDEDYDPEDTEAFPDVTTALKIEKIEEDPDVTVDLALPTGSGSSIKSYYPIRAQRVDGILTDEQPRGRLCGIPLQGTERTESYTPYMSTYLNFVSVYYGEIYLGVALGELESLSPDLCPFGVEAGQLALTDSLVGVGGYIMINRSGTLNSRIYDLQYNHFQDVLEDNLAKVLVEASAQTILDEDESYVDAINFKASSNTTFGGGSRSKVELDPNGLRFWSYD